jgi:hypothetical protein
VRVIGSPRSTCCVPITLILDAARLDYRVECPVACLSRAERDRGKPEQMTDQRETGASARVEVTAKFLAETNARQRAYEARRRIWTAAFHSSDPRAQPAARSRGRGAIHDPRQSKLDL